MSPPASKQASASKKSVARRADSALSMSWRAVLGAGKAIYLEKPVATTPEDASAVCRLAACHSNVFRVG
ncbi:MAG: Gfo/Idh/MocA family oxidoreductase, partial [Pseudomonadales bacterium]|nr:Gfo/Idh/MocA family oxidoreductase [Pseudomonadales bacterium]